MLADGADQRDRHADVDLIVIDPIGEAGLAVRQFQQALAGEPFGIVHHRDHQTGDAVRAVTVDQIVHPAGGDLAGRQLRPQVTEDPAGQADVALDHAEQRGVRVPRSYSFSGGIRSPSA